MPYSIAIERIAQQQLVRQSQGEDARHTQFLVGHAVAAGLQAEVLALPLSTDDLNDIIDAQSSVQPLPLPALT